MVNEVLDRLVKDLDNQTEAVLQSLPECKRPVFAMMGDIENSPFLRAVKKKADWFGLKYDSYSSDTRRCFYCRPVIYDRESCNPAILSKVADVDRTQFDGMSCVSEAVYLLLKRLDLIAYKDITIIGRGHAVKGLAQKLIDGDATVTVAHSKTKNMLHATDYRDVLVVATPKLYHPVYPNTKELVIDIGNSVPSYDFDCERVNNIGKLTVSVLMARIVCGG